MQENVKNINIDLLIPFENHPFKRRDGHENEELKESVKENGLLQPIIVRSFSAGTYEIISGHRRVEVCKELGIQTVPAIVREMSKDTCTKSGKTRVTVFCNREEIATPSPVPTPMEK